MAIYGPFHTLNFGRMMEAKSQGDLAAAAMAMLTARTLYPWTADHATIAQGLMVWCIDCPANWKDEPESGPNRLTGAIAFKITEVTGFLSFQERVRKSWNRDSETFKWAIGWVKGHLVRDFKMYNLDDRPNLPASQPGPATHAFSHAPGLTANNPALVGFHHDVSKAPGALLADFYAHRWFRQILQRDTVLIRIRQLDPSLPSVTI
jgi:hypothetical protein